jgi:hypothetical protein
MRRVWQVVPRGSLPGPQGALLLPHWFYTGAIGAAAAVQLGRAEGQLEAAVRERDLLLGEEFGLRRMLIEQRQRWLRLIAEQQRMGHDTSSIVTQIDLTVPPPAAEDLLPEDEERDFVARAIDGLH